MTALQTRITGKLPVYSYTSQDSHWLDQLGLTETEVLFSGCLDATHCVPSGSVSDCLYNIPRTTFQYR